MSNDGINGFNNLIYYSQDTSQTGLIEMPYKLIIKKMEFGI